MLQVKSEAASVGLSPRPMRRGTRQAPEGVWRGIGGCLVQDLQGSRLSALLLQVDWRKGSGAHQCLSHGGSA